MPIKINLHYHDKQAKIFRDDTSRIIVARCGRKFGKSMGSRGWITREALSSEATRVAYIAPEYKYIVPWWNEYKNIYNPIIREAGKTPNTCTFVNGAVLDMFSMENIDAMRPREYDAVCIDEAALSPYCQDAVESVVKATLMKRQGKLLIMSTPKANTKGGEYFRDLIMRAADGDKTISTHHYTSYDNPYIPVEEINSFKETMPSLVFQQEILAEFVELDGAVMRRDQIKYYSTPPDLGSLTIGIGVDLAISERTQADYTAIVVVGKDENGNHYVLDVVRKRMSFHDTQEAIKAVGVKWNPIVINIEEVQYQSAMIQELVRTTHLPVRGIKPRKDKLTRALPLVSKVERGYLHLLPTQVELANELTEFPVGMHDDMVDALVYAVEAVESEFWVV